MVYLMAESYFISLLHAIKEYFIEEMQIGDIGVLIREAISSKEIFSLSIGGVSFSFSEAIVTTWIVMAVIGVLGYWMGRNMQEIPKTKQTMVEALANVFIKLCEDQHMTPKQAEIVAPYVGSMVIFISLSNVIAAFKMKPPAKDPVFPIALALFTLGYVIFTGIRFVGIKGFLASFTYPKSFLIPFKILDYVIRPISLSLRLFGNIFGAFILMEFVYVIFPAILPGVVGLWFDLLDGILQGVVFCYLTVIYIGEIIEGAEGAEHAKAESARVKAAKAVQKQAAGS